MSDRIKKIKIKQADGTFSDYIPIGADAKNIDTDRGENLQNTLNKISRYYHTVEAMKIDDSLKENDICTVILDNGENIIYKISSSNNFGLELNNGLFAQLLINNFNIFPNDDIIALLPNNSTFTTKGFYEVGDGGGTTYFVTTEWKANSLKRGNFYIIPIYQNDGELFMPYLGIRDGEDYAELNSNIIESINFINFGATLLFPSGHYYFDRTIALEKQNNIKGAGASFTSDLNTNGLTWLHFPNLQENEAAITSTTGTLSDFMLVGNPETYTLSIDRDQTVIAPDKIVNETYKYITYGIKHDNMGQLNIQNVGFRNFYYGAWIHTANITISHIYIRNCHYGISIGNDTRITQLFAWSVMIALQMRGSISSATQIRGDSIGKHLVEITTTGSYGGSITGIILSDLDADYCVGSIIHLGSDDVYESVVGLYINGVRGRACVYTAFDSTLQEDYDISTLTEDLVEYVGFLSISAKERVYDGYIIINQSVMANANPLDDNSSTYRCPSVIFTSKADVNITGMDFHLISGNRLENLEISKNFIRQKIKSYSHNVTNIDIALTTYKEKVIYKRTGVSEETFLRLYPEGEVLDE